MDHFDLVTNTVVKCIDKSALSLTVGAYYRILYCDTRDMVCVLIAIKRNHIRPFTCEIADLFSDLHNQRIEISEVAPRRHQLLDESELSTEQKDRRDKKWQLIEELVAEKNIPGIFFPIFRGPLVARQAENLNVYKKAILRALFSYWAGGSEKNALLPRWDECGPHGDTKVTRQQSGQRKRGPKNLRSKIFGDEQLNGLPADVIRTKILMGIARFAETGVSKMKIWTETKRHFFSRESVIVNGTPEPVNPPPHLAPSMRQFMRVYDEENANLALKKIEVSADTFNLKFRAKKGHVRDSVFGPCDRFEIDATIVDVYCVSIFNRAWLIGRPVLYVVIDEFSRTIVGYYLGLEGPSWEGARLALFNAFSDKVAHCARLNIKIEPEAWPCHHLPHKVLGDRGEMIKKSSNELPRSLGVWAQNTAPYRGDWKPFVESHFRLLDKNTIQFLPGHVVPREIERRKRDYALDGALTLIELEQILIRCFLKYNQTNFQANSLPEQMLLQNLTNATPLSLWMWGIEHYSGMPKRPNPIDVWTGLLPRGKAIIREDGIYFERRRYDTPMANKFEWYAKSRISGRKSIEIRYLPSNPCHIWLRNLEACEWTECTLLDKDDLLQHARIEELQDREKLLELARLTVAESRYFDNARLDGEISQLIANAAENASQVRKTMTGARRVRNIKVNRILEKEVLRSQQNRPIDKKSQVIVGNRVNVRSNVTQESNIEERDTGAFSAAQETWKE